jgi:undecaprenyl pyrophosphate synthase
VLSRGRVQKTALKELAALPINDPLRQDVGELLANYRTVLENRKKRTEEEEELIMNLAPEYLQKQQDWKQEGVQEVALNCLRKGMVIDLIAELTGLSPEAIQKLSQSLQTN